MFAVWKFPLEATDEQTLSLPIGAQILSVAEQRGDIVLYVMTRLSAPKTGEKYLIRIVGTGHEIEANSGRFIGTVNLSNGSLMFHVFVQGPLS